MSGSITRVAVIGGGITGLSAASTFQEEGDGRVQAVLLEATDRCGGKILTEDWNGITVESGADSFLVRERWALDLCRRLGLEDELVEPAGYGAQIWTNGKLAPLPVGFLRGVPAGVSAALRSEILSFPAALRTSIDLLWPTRLKGDVSFGRFVRRRFGSEVLEKLVDPIMAGTRAGMPEEVSLSAGAPEIAHAARTHRSVIRSLNKQRANGVLESGAPPFRSVKGGLSRLVEKLVASLTQVDIRPGTTVEAIEPAGDGYRIETGRDSIDADAIVLAAPAFTAAELLRGLVPAAANLLNDITYASVAGITLLFPPDSVVLPEGSGLLVPSKEGRILSACTWFSRKWPQFAPADGSIVIRCFVGRAGHDAALALDDDQLIAAVTKELSEALPIDQEPVAARVVRWDRSLPQYRVGHLDTVARIDDELKNTNIRVAGAGYRGSGIPDCVRQGRDAARDVLASTVGLHA